MAGLLVLLGAGCSKEARKTGYLERAERDFRAEEYQKAEIGYRNVLALDSANVVAIRNLGHIYYDRGDLAKGFVFLQRAKTLEPANLDVRFKLGLIYLAAGKATECKAEVDFILSKDPGHEGGLQLLVELPQSPEDWDALQERLQGLRTQLADRPGLPLALGRLFMRKGDLQAAEAEFQKVATLNPKSSEAHLGLGHIFLARKDLNRAQQEYQTAADLAPARSSVHLRLAEIKFLVGDYDGGRRVLEDLVDKAPDYIPALNRLGELSFANKDYDECDSLIRRVLALDPINFEALSNSARVKMARGKPAKAVEELERLVQMRPRSAPAQYQLALAYLGNRDTTNALSSLRQAVNLDPNLTGAALLLAELYLRQGEFPSAISVLQPLARPEPGKLPNERAHLLLARAYVAQGSLEEAMTLYRRLSSAGTRSPVVHYEMGLILLRQKQTAEARASFEGAVQLALDYLGQAEGPEKPKTALAEEAEKMNLAASGALVDLDLAEKKFEPATERVRGLIRQYPQAPEPVFLMARVYSAAGDTAQAEAALKKSIELDPEFTKAYLVLAQLYATSNRQQEAQKQLTESLSRNPQDRATLMLLAMLQHQARSYAEARTTYEQLLSFHPDFGPALNNLAFLYAEQFNQLDKALQLAQKARLKFPESPIIADTLGWVQYLRQDYSSALTLLRESIGKLPAEPEIRLHLGMAQYMTGDETGARASLELALKARPDLPGRAEAERRLSILAIDTARPDPTALTGLEQAVAQHPADPVAARRLAAIYEAQNAWDKAKSTYERLLQANPKAVFALLRLAELQSERFGNPTEALKLARTARELDPADPQVAYVLGRLANRAGDQKWALSLLQESRLKSPNNPAVLFELALSLYSVSRVAEAVTTMQEAVTKGLDQANSGEARKFLSLASLFENPTEAERSVAQIQDALNQGPAYAPALMAAAVVYARRGDSAAAQQACTRLLQRHSFFAPAHALLARLYAESGGDLQKAYEHAVKARETLPTDAEAAKALGIVSYHRADYARAVELLRESARTKTQDPELPYYLGLAHSQLKQTNEARQDLNRALGLQPDPKLAERIQQALGSLR